MNTETDDRPAAGFHDNGTSTGPTGIPGLSGATDGPEERGRGRRVGVMESDSDYVKLAKRGGQKGLLSHDGTNSGNKSNAAYAAPDWFADARDRPSPTDGKEKGVRSTAPFGSDNKSTWARDADDKKSGDSASSEIEKLSLTEEEKQDANKYRKTSHAKNSDQVSMSCLLGFGYATDGKEAASQDSSGCKE